jgi:hypothetical protein
MADETPDEAGTVTLWLEQLKDGDPAAAAPLWREYYAGLISLARQKLLVVPNTVADEEDIALAAFNSFCEGVRLGRFPDLTDRHDLWKVLFDITAKKAHGQVKYETALKRGGGKVRPASQVGDGQVDVTDGVRGREPSSAFAAEVADECRRLLALLDSDQLRQIAVWKMEGYTNAEIAAKIDRAVPAVERKLNLIRTTWTRLGVQKPATRQKTANAEG